MSTSKAIASLLPTEFQERLMRGVCIDCGQPFSDKNVFTKAGWAETRISQTCEKCFDALFEGEDG